MRKAIEDVTHIVYMIFVAVLLIFGIVLVSKLIALSDVHAGTHLYTGEANNLIPRIFSSSGFGVNEEFIFSGEDAYASRAVVLDYAKITSEDADQILEESVSSIWKPKLSFSPLEFELRISEINYNDVSYFEGEILYSYADVLTYSDFLDRTNARETLEKIFGARAVEIAFISAPEFISDNFYDFIAGEGRSYDSSEFCALPNKLYDVDLIVPMRKAGFMTFYEWEMKFREESKIILYSNSDCTGTSVELFESIANLGEVNFNDQTNSLSVHGPLSWTIYEHENYKSSIDAEFYVYDWGGCYQKNAFVSPYFKISSLAKNYLNDYRLDYAEYLFSVAIASDISDASDKYSFAKEVGCTTSPIKEVDLNYISDSCIYKIQDYLLKTPNIEDEYTEVMVSVCHYRRMDFKEGAYIFASSGTLI